MECEKLLNCPFYKKFESVRFLNPLLNSFMKNYCMGDKQDNCIRKKIANQYGSDKVPINMTPIGAPILGTNNDDWPEEALHPPK